MKKLLIVPIFVVLTGCSTLIDGIMGNYHNYDPIEYDRAVAQLVTARGLEAKCSTPGDYKATITHMASQLKYHQAYLEGRPYNKRTLELNGKLLSMVEDTAKRETMSAFFCKERSKNIVKAAEILRSSSGEKRE
jgi:hypothetical protein